MDGNQLFRAGHPLRLRVPGSHQKSILRRIERRIIYEKNRITLSDNTGNELTAIPENSFLATVSFTNVTSNENAVIVLAQYTKTGAFKNVIYVYTEDMPVGTTMKYKVPIDNKSGDVAYLKAFCWESFSSMMPVDEAVEYPVKTQ